jgi:hypothetical protein
LHAHSWRPEERAQRIIQLAVDAPHYQHWIPACAEMTIYWDKSLKAKQAAEYFPQTGGAPTKSVKSADESFR